MWFFDIELVLSRDPVGATPLASVNLSQNASLRFNHTNLHYEVRYWQPKGPLSSHLWRDFDGRSSISITVEGTRGDMTAVRHIVPDRCCGVIVDLQGFFLSKVDKRFRSRIKTNTGNLDRKSTRLNSSH